MKIYILVFLSFLFSATSCLAQNKYALLVGINEWMKMDPAKKGSGAYSRTENIPSLDDGMNDIGVIAEIIKAKFDFSSDHIATLKNQQATNAGIIQSLGKMKDKCSKGDIFFFFYSGHGSQVENDLSPELDKMDETICPYDAILHNKDIRDKQIAIILQEFVDKGVVVTAMFESCHSGSIARGIDVEEKMASTSNDIINDDKVYPQPGKNGALIIGAAQEFQTASCKKFDNGVWEGFFTKAFMEVMQKSRPDISVTDLFNAVSARIKSYGGAQIPSLDANNERLQATLFGTKTGDGVTHIAIEKMLPGNIAELQGGIALGLEKGTELVNTDNHIKLEVTDKTELTVSQAKVISGNAVEIKPGMIFKIEHYACNVNKRLQLHIPAAKQNYAELLAIADGLGKMVVQKNLKIVIDHALPADYLLYCKDGIWMLNTTKERKELGATPDINALSGMLEQGKTIKVLLPVCSEQATSIKKLLAEQYSTVNACDMGSSDYFIRGEVAGGKIVYSLTKTIPDTSALAAYPMKSNGYDAGDDKTIHNLCEMAWKLSKIKSWLTLDNTNNVAAFPYTLWLKNNRGKEARQDGVVKDGEKYTLRLVRSSGAGTTTKKRWVYVFDIAPDGSIGLLYPPSGQNEGNYLPAKEPADTAIDIVNEMDIQPPFGTDNLVMLTTDDPITNPAMLEQDGIATRSVGGNEIDALVANMNIRTRSVSTVKSINEWSVQRITLKSIPK